MSPLSLQEVYGERAKWRDNTSIVGTIHPPRNQSDPLSQEENPRSRVYASSDSSASSLSDGTISSDDSSEPHHSSEQTIENSERGQSTESSDEMRSGLMRWKIKQDPEVGDFSFEQELDQIDNVGTPMEYFLEYFCDDFCEKVCQLYNEYLRKKQPNSTFILTKLLLRQYAGVIIPTFVIRLGSLRRYWKDDSRIGYIWDNMSRKVFESINDNKNHKLYFDNWFNSVGLQVWLAKRGIQSVGTLQICRAKGLHFREIDQRKAPRGTHLRKTYTMNETELYAVQWIDNKPVTLLSTYCAVDQVCELERFDKEPILL